MKTFLKVIVMLAFCFGCSSVTSALAAPSLDAAEEKAIQQEVSLAFEGLADAVRAVDLDRYASFFDKEKYTGLNDDGTVLHSYQAFETTTLPALSYIEKYNKLEFNNVKIDVINAGTAILVNEYVAEVVLTSGQVIEAAGAGTQVWSKHTGQWKLVHVASSTKPQ